MVHILLDIPYSHSTEAFKSLLCTKAEGKIPFEGSVLFVSNHQGNFDIPILLGYIDKPKALIAKIELLKLPLIRTWMTHLKCVKEVRNIIRTESIVLELPYIT